MVQFILNNQTVTATQAKGSTILDYIRYYMRLMGTKIGCREGDCGACTILVGSLEADKLVYRSMTSCLMPLGNAQGKHIVTVEGINMQNISPVQQSIIDTNGTQCGFCTPGFVVSLTGFILGNKSTTYEQAVAAIDGNICRCTGYKSIERSAKIIAGSIAQKPESGTTDWLVINGFLPAYFLNIENRLRELQITNTLSPLENDTGKTKTIVAGGTDIVVQRPQMVKHSNVELLFDTRILRGIKEEEGQCIVGGGVTVTEFFESPLIQRIFPALAKHIKLVSSTPIRNMATMAGNIVNASPIGDMTVFFLALDASVVLARDSQQRTVKLKNFYKGYKQTDKEAEEIIIEILFDIPSEQTLFNFEKVSKRTNLDIASVNSACQLQMAFDTIETIHLSAGGVAPFPKYLSNTCAYLQGKKLETQTLEEALKIVNAEIAPISDARGSKEYKQLLLRQLVIAHFLQFFGPTEAIKKFLFQ
ncbi:MAG: (2Fe-2S)-binding protein [Flavisolibacter sp.]|jgi:xanthine dehydrogenase small subunit|nr:(2Fe-2S)-binding protein [Flavisolibacter sp.]